MSALQVFNDPALLKAKKTVDKAQLMPVREPQFIQRCARFFMRRRNV